VCARARESVCTGGPRDKSYCVRQLSAYDRSPCPALPPIVALPTRSSVPPSTCAGRTGVEGGGPLSQSSSSVLSGARIESNNNNNTRGMCSTATTVYIIFAPIVRARAPVRTSAENERARARYIFIVRRHNIVVDKRTGNTRW